METTETSASESSESELSDLMNYSSSSIALSEMSLGSDKEDRSVEDKGCQTDSLPNINMMEQPPKYDLRTCVNVNQCSLNLSYQDRVSLWVRGDKVASEDLGNNNDKIWGCASGSCNTRRNLHSEDKNSVVIVSREKVTLRINPGLHERRWVTIFTLIHTHVLILIHTEQHLNNKIVIFRLSTATLYEDIEEAGEWMSKDYLKSLKSSSSSSVTSPPPLPPRLFQQAPTSRGPRVNYDKTIRRKNLNHLLGIDEQMDLNTLKDNSANMNAIKNLQEIGRVKSKKDLTKFLGLNEAKLRKRANGKKHADHRRSKSIIDNIFSATKHFKSNNNDQSCHIAESQILHRDQDQGRHRDRINLEADGAVVTKDVTQVGEDSDNLGPGGKIETGNENEKRDSIRAAAVTDKSRTSSFSSSSRSSSSSRESLGEEKSSFTKMFRNSTRRFSTSGIELMDSFRRKSSVVKKVQSSLEDIPLESSFSSDRSSPEQNNVYKDRSYIEEFIAQGLPVIPFDQPLMALIDEEPKKSLKTKNRNDDYIRVSDSLDTLIRLARGELANERTGLYSSSQSEAEEPIYIEMSKAGKPKISQAYSVAESSRASEYMDMDVVQAALSSFRYSPAL